MKIPALNTIIHVGAFILFTNAIACGDDATSNSSATTGNATALPTTSTTTSGAECPGPGFVGCPCTEDDKCLEGLKCLPSINTCIDPSDITAGMSTTGSETSGAPECPEGLEGCACADGDLCIVGLECILGICEPVADTTDSGGDECVDDYQPCESQLNCCDFDQHCLDFTGTNGGGVVCAPECISHTECPSKCCGGVQDLNITVCYSAPCESLCINTCLYAYDGECDDGGPGSDFDVCEYGTDCADCGLRSSAGAP